MIVKYLRNIREPSKNAAMTLVSLSNSSNAWLLVYDQQVEWCKAVTNRITIISNYRNNLFYNFFLDAWVQCEHTHSPGEGGGGSFYGRINMLTFVHGTAVIGGGGLAMPCK
jgi:hypothetical protein